LLPKDYRSHHANRIGRQEVPLTPGTFIHYNFERGIPSSGIPQSVSTPCIFVQRFLRIGLAREKKITQTTTRTITLLLPYRSLDRRKGKKCPQNIKDVHRKNPNTNKITIILPSFERYQNGCIIVFIENECTPRIHRSYNKQQKKKPFESATGMKINYAIFFSVQDTSV